MTGNDKVRIINLPKMEDEWETLSFIEKDYHNYMAALHEKAGTFHFKGFESKVSK